jgi:hypothetical protein
MVWWKFTNPPLKHLQTSTRLHSSTTQKMILFKEEDPVVDMSLPTIICRGKRKDTVIHTLLECQTSCRWVFACPVCVTKYSEWHQEVFHLDIFSVATEEKMWQFWNPRCYFPSTKHMFGMVFFSLCNVYTMFHWNITKLSKWHHRKNSVLQKLSIAKLVAVIVTTQQEKGNYRMQWLNSSIGIYMLKDVKENWDWS